MYFTKLPRAPLTQSEDHVYSYMKSNMPPSHILQIHFAKANSARYFTFYILIKCSISKLSCEKIT